MLEIIGKTIFTVYKLKIFAYLKLWFVFFSCSKSFSIKYALSMIEIVTVFI